MYNICLSVVLNLLRLQSSTLDMVFFMNYSFTHATANTENINMLVKWNREIQCSLDELVLISLSIPIHNVKSECMDVWNISATTGDCMLQVLCVALVTGGKKERISPQELLEVSGGTGEVSSKTGIKPYQHLLFRSMWRIQSSESEDQRQTHPPSGAENLGF